MADKTLESTIPRISTLSGDAFLNHQMFDATMVACATKLHGMEIEGGLMALGLLDDPVSWDLRHQNLHDAAGHPIPVPPFPARPARPVRPPANCTALAFAQFQYDTGVYSTFLKDCLRLDNAIHEALGPDRIDEIKSSTTGMANITPHMIRVFFRNRYGVLTMAKLIQLKDSLKSLGGRDAQGYFAHAARVHDIFEGNGQTFNELEKQECAALALSYDERLNRFYQRYQEKFLTMASRTYAALVTFILLHDASSPRPESAYSARANKPNGATASATHGKHDDDDDDDNYDYDDDFDQQSYQDGFAAGMSAASVTTRSTHFGPNLDKRLDTLDATLAKLTDAITKIALPSSNLPNGNHYCFVHGSNSRHPGISCGAMQKDANYTLDMRQAKHKCALVANDGTTLTGAN